MGALYCCVYPNTSLSIFYIIPIGFAAWYAGERAGRVISVLSALTWASTYYATIGLTAHSPVLYWNGSVRLAFFIIIASLLSGLKNKTEKLNDLAHIDFLTETSNSRAFYIRLEEEINRSHRYRSPFTLAYIDLDNFKTINDLYVHTAGDNLLRSITASMKTTRGALTASLEWGETNLRSFFRRPIQRARGM